MAATLKRSGFIAACGVLLAITHPVTAEETPGAAKAPETPAPPAPTAPLILKKFAGDVFNLDQFALQIPIDDDGDGISDVVKMPLLRNFEDPAFFHIDKLGEAIVFRTRRGEARMEGATHPRCEMRELKKGTEEPASWSTKDGKVHNFSTTLAFTRLPEDGTPVTAVSVWGETGEVLAVRHGKGKVVMSRVGMEPFILEESYAVGTPFEFMILLDKGRVRLLRDTNQIAEWPLEAEGLHFRVGVVYEAGAPESGEPKSTAEVTIWKLYLTHK
jgi:hypothetical protein